MFLLHRGSAYKLDSLDTTGLDVRGRCIARAIQPASLVLFTTAARELAGDQAGIDDLHDAYLEEDACYVVSTRGNEIVQMDYSGNEQRRWTFPGEVDAWHVNCTVRWNGRMVFSAFTDRTLHRAYKEPPFDAGFVQELETGERPITGLFQPHSLVPDGERLLLANSGAFELHEYDADGRLLRKRGLDGYTRGVARCGSVVYVGLSKSRNVESEATPGAAVVALDTDTWEELGRIRLPVDEIYSVIPLADGIDPIGVLARIAAHANARSAGVLARAEEARVAAVQGREQLAEELQLLRDKDDKRLDALDARLAQLDEGLASVNERVKAQSAELEARIRRHQEALQAIEARLQRQYTLLNTVMLRLEQAAGDRLADRVVALTGKVDAMAGALDVRHGSELEASRRALEASNARVVRLRASTSWRLTRPLRWVSVHVLRRPPGDG
jgi:hypothetical protein